jgi:transcriptional regulator with XRE-family HTH domain
MTLEYVNSALPGVSPASTFALQMLRDKQAKLELAGRMRRAWKDSGHPQKVIAQAVGLEHRSYQKALQTGGISYEKLEAMAEFLDVDFDWLRTGRERGDTPDLSMNGNGPTDRLQDVEARLEEVLDVLRDNVLPALSTLEAAVDELRSGAVAPKPRKRRAT